MPAELESLLGDVRSHSERYRAGGRAAFGAFESLVSGLLHLTVLDARSQVRLIYGPDRSRAVLAGSEGSGDGLRLNDGRFLRMDVRLALGAPTPAPRLLKVEKASYQYQRQRSGRDGGGWIFRYDYLRQPGSDWHPGSHLQLDGSLVHGEALPEGLPLRRIHFPVGRIGIEAVIRLLADEFQVPTNAQGATWRPVLAEAERLFLDIAHQPLSGPAS